MRLTKGCCVCFVFIYDYFFWVFIVKKADRCQKLNIFLFSLLAVDRILDNELLCECNGTGCDKEITDVIGNGYNGVCRARRGGVCRKVIEYDDAGNMRDVSLAYVIFKLIFGECPRKCHFLLFYILFIVLF